MAALLWRAMASLRLPVLERYADGSCLSAPVWNRHCRSRNRRPIPVRLVPDTLLDVTGAEARYRLVTTIVEPARASARELAALYHERWEIQSAFDEVKTHLRGARCVLQSKTPELVRQEARGAAAGAFRDSRALV